MILQCLYNDELFYSYLARCQVRSAFMSYFDMAKFLYIRPHNRPEIRFVNPLREEVRARIEEVKPWTEIAEKHTMLPQYRFIDCDRLQKAFQLVCDGKTILNYTRNKKDGNDYLYYCPECAKEDRLFYGETYWHRSHQIDGLHICAKHGCYLEPSDLRVKSKESPSLTPAEVIVPYGREGRPCENEKTLQFVRFCNEVFNAPLFYGEYPSVGEYLSFSIDNSYLSKNGMTRKMELLYSDFLQFENELGLDRSLSLTSIEKVYAGKNWNFVDVCELAYFEQIPAEKLSDSSLWEKQIPRNALYEEIAQELCVDYSLVRTVGDEVIKRYRAGRLIQKKGGRREFQWTKMDAELLPDVERACKELYGDGVGRPGKVTVKGVQRLLGLPDRHFDKLPRCKEEISRWGETQHQYWAREVVWAYEKLKKEGCLTFSWKRIRELTNMRPDDFRNCKPYLEEYTNPETANRIKSLL